MAGRSLAEEFHNAARGGRGIDQHAKIIVPDKAGAAGLEAAKVAEAIQLAAVLKPDPTHQKQDMPPQVWQSLYANRNGQLVEIVSLRDAEKIRSMAKELPPYSNYNGNSYLTANDIINTKDMSYTSFRTRGKKFVKSWGDFVEFCVDRGFDLTGLAISPEQAKYRFEFELQKKNLGSAILVNARLDNFDLTGTNFSASQLYGASLRNTTGKMPIFHSTQAYKADFSHASYTEPNFTDFKGDSSIHFRSSYDMPLIRNTSFVNSRLSGTRFIMKRAEGEMQISNAFAPGLMIYGAGSDIVNPNLSYSRASMPGSCFFNILMTGGAGRAQKGDFSALLLDDPRLNDEEREYFASFGQWLNSEHAMDGVKVSPEVVPAVEKGKIFSMFSEVRIDVGQVTGETLFFSKGPVISRGGFHEAALKDMTDILPDSLAQKIRKVDTPVIAVAEASKETVPQAAQSLSGGVDIPRIEFDKEQVAAQIEAVKKASVAEAMTIGLSAQRYFTDASTIVTNWAMAELSRKPEFVDHIGRLINDLEVYSIVPPAPPPAPEPPAAPVQQNRGFFASLVSGFLGEEEPAVAPVSQPQVVAEDRFDKVIRRNLQALPDFVGAAVTGNTTAIQNVESLKTYLETLQEVITAYTQGIEEAMPEIEEQNPKIKSVLNLRLKNMQQSGEGLARLCRNVDDFMQMEIMSGTTIQWVQGSTIPDLNGQFSKAVALHNLDLHVKSGSEAYRRDPKLAGLYALTVTKPEAEVPAIQQIRQAFSTAQEKVVDTLKQVHREMVRVESGLEPEKGQVAIEGRSTILRRILSPA